MLYIVVIILCVLLGAGGGYGLFTLTKPENKEQTPQTIQTNKADANVSSNTQQQYISDKEEVTKLAEGLTKESAIVFIEMRSHILGISEKQQAEIKRRFEKMCDKLPVVEAFKIIALQYHLMRFSDFKDSKI
ncbi:MAG: hypothetical protein N3A62_05720 [Thermodesulfovibrionales bacterium]|nr:hypothetical protein [Thermodesulfovibrionales bacterium]